MPDGSIVLMGGRGSGSRLNDVWRSTDNGASWTQMTANAGWSPRDSLSSIVIPEGSILLMGGDAGATPMNDIWRSTDNGATWTRVTEHASWPGRKIHSGVILRTGRIVLTGGNDGSTSLNDVWRLDSAGSSVQNPSHTYTTDGIHDVTLQVSRSSEYNRTTKERYIFVGQQDKVGVFRNWTHLFHLDYNGNGTWDGITIDRRYDFGTYNDIPIAGDWNGDGRTEIGVYRNSTHRFMLDYNGNGIWDGVPDDREYIYGISNDTPVVGDWNGDGRTKIGIFRHTTHRFLLDYNGNGTWDDTPTDVRINFGTYDDIPVSGDWNNDGKSEVGVFRNANLSWYLDLDGDASLDDDEGPFEFGTDGDIPIAGDWNGNGFTDIGVYRLRSARFLLDYNEDRIWKAADDVNYQFVSGNYSVSGRW
jgi:PKD repeat protein